MARCERLAVDLLRPDRAVVARAARVIRAGGVAAVPTDTLYGLAADPFNAAAVKKLFRIKRRPENMPILLLVDSLQRMENLVARTPEGFRSLAARFWPGPLTMILPARPGVPCAVTAGSGTVAVRLPRSALIRSLVRLARRPLTGTSANLSGRAGGRSADEADRSWALCSTCCSTRVRQNGRCRRRSSISRGARRGSCARARFPRLRFCRPRPAANNPPGRVPRFVFQRLVPVQA